MTQAVAKLPPLGQVYAELRGTLLGYLRQIVGDRHAAEDLLHDVMIKALALGKSQSKPPDNLAAWLHTVARNAAIDHLRARRPTAELPPELAAADEPSFGEALAQCLRPLAARLPAPYRDTLIAAEFEGAPLAALARAENVSVSAIKSRTSRGRKLLRERLAQCCQMVLEADGLDYDERKASRCGQGACRES